MPEDAVQLVLPREDANRLIEWLGSQTTPTEIDADLGDAVTLLYRQLCDAVNR